MRAARRAVKFIAIGVWALMALLWTASVILMALLRDLYCEYPTGDSIYGDARWSLWPFGVSCVWEPPAVPVRETQGVGWELTISGLVLGAGGFVIAVWLARRRSGGPSTHAEPVRPMAAPGGGASP